MVTKGTKPNVGSGRPSAQQGQHCPLPPWPPQPPRLCPPPPAAVAAPEVLRVAIATGPEGRKMAAVAVPAREVGPGGSFRRYLARLGALRTQPGAERSAGGRRTELHLLFDQLISENCGPAPAAGPSAQVPGAAACGGLAAA